MFSPRRPASPRNNVEFLAPPNNLNMVAPPAQYMAPDFYPLHGPKTRNNSIRNNINKLTRKMNRTKNKTNKRTISSRINRLKRAIGHPTNPSGYNGWVVEPANNGYLDTYFEYAPVAAPPPQHVAQPAQYLAAPPPSPQHVLQWQNTFQYAEPNRYGGSRKSRKSRR